MNIVKKLILGTAILGGLTVGSIPTYANMDPLPVTFFNYQWKSTKKIMDASSLTSATLTYNNGVVNGVSLSGASKIIVQLVNGTTNVGDSQPFYYISDDVWEALAKSTDPDAINAYKTTKRFQVNSFGLMYFRFDMGESSINNAGITDISRVTANHKLKIMVENTTNVSGYISILDILRSYYQAGKGFEVIANANTEEVQQQAGVVVAVTPKEGDIQYGFKGGYTNREIGTAGQILLVKDFTFTENNVSVTKQYPVWENVGTILASNTITNLIASGNISTETGNIYAGYDENDPTKSKIILNGTDGKIKATSLETSGAIIGKDLTASGAVTLGAADDPTTTDNESKKTQILGPLQYTGSTPTNGYVLTTDANGNATWTQIGTAGIANGAVTIDKLSAAIPSTTLTNPVLSYTGTPASLQWIDAPKTTGADNTIIVGNGGTATSASFEPQLGNSTNDGKLTVTGNTSKKVILDGSNGSITGESLTAAAIQNAASNPTFSVTSAGAIKGASLDAGSGEIKTTGAVTLGTTNATAPTTTTVNGNLQIKANGQTSPAMAAGQILASADENGTAKWINKSDILPQDVAGKILVSKQDANGNATTPAFANDVTVGYNANSTENAGKLTVTDGKSTVVNSVTINGSDGTVTATGKITSVGLDAGTGEIKTTGALNATGAVTLGTTNAAAPTSATTTTVNGNLQIKANGATIAADQILASSDINGTATWINKTDIIPNGDLNTAYVGKQTSTGSNAFSNIVKLGGNENAANIALNGTDGTVTATGAITGTSLTAATIQNAASNPTFSVTSAGAIKGASLDAGSGEIKTTGTVTLGTSGATPTTTTVNGNLQIKANGATIAADQILASADENGTAKWINKSDILPQDVAGKILVSKQDANGNATTPAFANDVTLGYNANSTENAGKLTVTDGKATPESSVVLDGSDGSISLSRTITTTGQTTTSIKYSAKIVYNENDKYDKTYELPKNKLSGKYYLVGAQNEPEIGQVLSWLPKGTGTKWSYQLHIGDSSHEGSINLQNAGNTTTLNSQSNGGYNLGVYLPTQKLNTDGQTQYLVGAKYDPKAATYNDAGTMTTASEDAGKILNVGDDGVPTWSDITSVIPANLELGNGGTTKAAGSLKIYDGTNADPSAQITSAGAITGTSLTAATIQNAASNPTFSVTSAGAITGTSLTTTGEVKANTLKVGTNTTAGKALVGTTTSGEATWGAVTADGITDGAVTAAKLSATAPTSSPTNQFLKYSTAPGNLEWASVPNPVGKKGTIITGNATSDGITDAYDVTLGNYGTAANSGKLTVTDGKSTVVNSVTIDGSDGTLTATGKITSVGLDAGNGEIKTTGALNATGAVTLGTTNAAAPASATTTTVNGNLQIKANGATIAADQILASSDANGTAKWINKSDIIAKGAKQTVYVGNGTGATDNNGFSNKVELGDGTTAKITLDGSGNGNITAKGDVQTETLHVGTADAGGKILAGGASGAATWSYDVTLGTTSITTSIKGGLKIEDGTTGTTDDISIGKTAGAVQLSSLVFSNPNAAEKTVTIKNTNTTNDPAVTVGLPAISDGFLVSASTQKPVDGTVLTGTGTKTLPDFKAQITLGSENTTNQGKLTVTGKSSTYKNNTNSITLNGSEGSVTATGAATANSLNVGTPANSVYPFTVSNGGAIKGASLTTGTGAISGGNLDATGTVNLGTASTGTTTILGPLTYTGSTPTANYVLKTDASGKATWGQVTPGVITPGEVGQILVTKVNGTTNESSWANDVTIGSTSNAGKLTITDGTNSITGTNGVVTASSSVNVGTGTTANSITTYPVMITNDGKVTATGAISGNSLASADVITGENLTLGTAGSNYGLPTAKNGTAGSITIYGGTALSVPTATITSAGAITGTSITAGTGTINGNLTATGTVALGTATQSSNSGSSNIPYQQTTTTVNGNLTVGNNLVGSSTYPYSSYLPASTTTINGNVNIGDNTTNTLTNLYGRTNINNLSVVDLTVTHNSNLGDESGDATTIKGGLYYNPDAVSNLNTNKQILVGSSDGKAAWANEVELGGYYDGSYSRNGKLTITGSLIVNDLASVSYHYNDTSIITSNGNLTAANLFATNNIHAGNTINAPTIVGTGTIYLGEIGTNGNVIDYVTTTENAAKERIVLTQSDGSIFATGSIANRNASIDKNGSFTSVADATVSVGNGKFTVDKGGNVLITTGSLGVKQTITSNVASGANALYSANGNLVLDEGNINATKGSITAGGTMTAGKLKVSRGYSDGNAPTVGAFLVAKTSDGDIDYVSSSNVAGNVLDKNGSTVIKSINDAAVSNENVINANKLPANIAYKDAANTFTADQTVTGLVTANNVKSNGYVQATSLAVGSNNNEFTVSNSGAITGASLVATGDVKGGSLTTTGAATVGSLNAGSGTITTTGAATLGATTASSLTTTGALSAGTTTLGATTVASLDAGSGTVKGGALSVNSITVPNSGTSTFSVTEGGAITGTSLNAGSGAITTTGALNGATLTTTGLATVNTLKVGTASTAGQALIASGTDGTAVWGQIGTAGIAKDAITATQIADNTITSSKMTGGTTGYILKSKGNTAPEWVKVTDLIETGAININQIAPTNDNAILMSAYDNNASGYLTKWQTKLANTVYTGGTPTAGVLTSDASGNITWAAQAAPTASEIATTINAGSSLIDGTKIKGGTAGQILVSTGTTSAAAWSGIYDAINGTTTNTTAINASKITGGTDNTLANTVYTGAAPTQAGVLTTDASGTISWNAASNITGSYSISTVSTASAAAASTSTVILCSGFTDAITLPTTGVSNGTIKYIVNQGTQTITVDPNGTDSNGNITVESGQTLMVIWSGSIWVKLSKN